MMACQNGNAEVAELLIDLEADINARENVSSVGYRFIRSYVQLL
jgi:ankyrin repeat protein